MPSSASRHRPRAASRFAESRVPWPPLDRPVVDLDRGVQPLGLGIGQVLHDERTGLLEGPRVDQEHAASPSAASRFVRVLVERLAEPRLGAVEVAGLDTASASSASSSASLGRIESTKRLTSASG